MSIYTANTLTKTLSSASITYLTTAEEAPERFDLSAGTPPGPLPLLVFGLDGTLVWRGGGKGSKNSVNPTPRPYLGPFLEYVFGTGEKVTTFEQRGLLWARKGRDDFRESWASKPHGTTFWSSSSSDGSTNSASSVSATSKSSTDDAVWKSHALEPTPAAAATYRTIIWSSAAAHNVESMTRAILTPLQAGQLLRVWSRDTLVPDRWLNEKAVTTKDLELVWDALNVDASAASKFVQDGEKRIRAQYRYDKIVRDADSSVQDLADLLAMSSLLAPSFVRLPQRTTKDGEKWRNGRGYAQHNTLVLESEAEKARLQPYNHLLLPEFDEERAELVRSWRLSRCPTPPPARMDDVLLQLIGVLAHARWQRDISAWICGGGLGFFGGMSQPSMEAYTEKAAKVEDTDTQLALATAFEKRTQSFWASEGRKALKAAGIPCKLE